MICLYDSCGRASFCKGYCKGHYYQQRRGSELTPIVPHNEKHECHWPDCTNVVWARVDYCANHARKVARYNLTPDDITKIAGKAECDLCGWQGGLHIDHDHVTGRVRGMLCMVCNTKMGTIDDKPWLARALRYVVDVDA